VAAFLSNGGIRPGDRVLLSIGNRPEFIACMFGAMRAGAVPVPLNTRQGYSVLEYIARDSGCSGVIADPTVNASVLKLAESMPLRLRVTVGSGKAGWHSLTDAKDLEWDFDPPSLTDDALCFLAYTSGSTGKPKGVPLTHRGQLWWVHAATTYWPADADDRSLVAMPLYHKNAMAGAVKPRLYSGGTVVLMPRFDVGPYLDAIERYRCTHLGGVPTMYAMLLEEGERLAHLDLSSLKVVVVGSAPVHEELVRKMSTVFGVPILQSYGMTEGGPVMLGPPVGGGPVPPASVGRAWPEGEVRLVAPDGTVSETSGELWVRNPGVTPGYYNLPEVNQDRFVDGWLRTGDLFTRDADGFYYFQGRVDDMFNCGGENIYPKEVENILLRHPGVREACVVPVEHATKGHAPVAMVSLRAGAETDEQELKSFCLAEGPAYAHPRRVVIVADLPISGAGKIDRSAIKQALGSELGVLRSS